MFWVLACLNEFVAGTARQGRLVFRRNCRRKTLMLPMLLQGYPGNRFSQTLGNITADSRIGLVFIDFETGSLLHVTGRARIDWHPPAAMRARMPGALRVIHVHIDAVVERPHAVPLRWRRDDSAWLPLRVATREQESVDVVSFYLAATDGVNVALPPFEPGQHLPISVRVPGRDAPLRRTYSLSNARAHMMAAAGVAAGGACYRISVKREPGGAVSTYLHDAVSVGDVLHARKPAGTFTLPPGRGTVVLVAAGIGVTPLLPMLHALLAAQRHAVFVHGVRDGQHHPLVRDYDGARSHDCATVHVAYSRPSPKDRVAKSSTRSSA